MYKRQTRNGIEQKTNASDRTDEYQLVWSDEFDTNGLPDPAKWTYDKGNGLFISPPLGLVSSRSLRAAIALSREGLARVRIRVKLRMTKGVVFFFPYRTAIRSGLTYIILGAIRTYLQY